jgi:hypothetical protein
VVEFELHLGRNLFGLVDLAFVNIALVLYNLSIRAVSRVLRLRFELNGLGSFRVLDSGFFILTCFGRLVNNFALDYRDSARSSWLL